VFAALAQLERDNIVERTTSGRDERGKIDGEKGGRLPYAYIRTPDGIEIDKMKAGAVRVVFKARKRGSSLRAIAALLNAAGTAGPSGGVWHASSVAEVLKNEDAYRGGRRGESESTWPRMLA